MPSLHRLLSLIITAILLTACTAQPAQPGSSYRVLSLVEVPLQLAPADVAGQPFRREFEQRNIQGTINDAGRWTIEGVVDHTRFFCGTYEMGIQLGRGVEGCAQTQWFNEPQYGTRERQCNSASLIHAGGGSLPVSREQVATASCVRVLVRCSGTCG